MSTHPINFSDVGAVTTIPTLGSIPGQSIKSTHRGGNADSSADRPSAMANRIYANFRMKQLPLLKNEILTLFRYQNITPVHLPLFLDTIFFNFIDELIGHYQNQIEDKKNENLNQSWIDLKHFLITKGAQPWSKDDFARLEKLFHPISTELQNEGAPAVDFLEIIKPWKKILSVTFAGRIWLASLFEKTALTKALDLKEDALLETDILLSQADIFRTFFLAVRQFQKDSSWILPLLSEKVALFDQKLLESDLRKSFIDIEEKYSSFSIAEIVNKYAERMQEALKLVSSTNIEDPKDVEKLYNHFKDLGAEGYIIIRFPRSILQLVGPYKKPDGTRIEVIDMAGELIEVTKQIREHLGRFEELFYLQRYLESQAGTFLCVATSLDKASKNWRKYQEGGPIPPLAPHTSLLHLALGNPMKITMTSADMAAQQLLEEEEEKTKKKAAEPKNNKNNKEVEKPKGKKAKTNNTSKKQVNKSKQIKTSSFIDITPIKPNTNTTSKNQANTIKSTKINPFNDITPVKPNTLVPIKQNSISEDLKLEELNHRLMLAYEENPSHALRQALWHLNALRVLRNSASETTTSAECLTLANAVTYRAQKVIEQTYRFRVKKEGEPFAKIHNLKTYHREFKPEDTSYPKAVKNLFDANTWCRYFYFQHHHWHALTSINTKTPSIIDFLFDRAEGRSHPHPLQDLQELIDSTIKDVCECVEIVLDLEDKKASNSQSSAIQYEPLKLQTPLSLTAFNEVSQNLKALLNSIPYNPNYPSLAHLSIKQALAALSMLQVSLQKMNEAKDIRVFSTWTVCCLQQLQESMEHVLHSINYCGNEEASTQHDIGTLAEQAGMSSEDIGTLGDQFYQLLDKTRYAAEVEATTDAGHIIDDLEAFTQHPDILIGYVVNTQKMLWAKMPHKDSTPDTIVIKLNELFNQSATFLGKALLLLEEKL